MIKPVDGFFGVDCDFCGKSLGDWTSTGGILASSKQEAGVLAKHFDWFVDGDKHYCTDCVPATQSMRTSKLAKYQKIFFPFCSPPAKVLTVLLLLAIFTALYHVAFLAVGVGLVAYGLHIRSHYLLHQRDEAVELIVEKNEIETEEED